MINKIILILLLACSLFAEQNASEKNLTLVQNSVKLTNINASLESGNIWIRKYNDYLTYKNLLSEQEDIKNKIYSLKRQNASAGELKNYQKRLDSIKNQLALLEQYKRSTLGDLTLIGDVGAKPDVTNPIAIFYALTFIQKAVDQISSYKQRLGDLDKTIDLLDAKSKLLKEKLSLEDNKSGISEQIEQTNAMIRDFENEREDFESTITIYETKTQDMVKTLQGEIKAELTKLAIIALIILVIIAIVMISKRFAHKYWSDSHPERLYVSSKIINFNAFILILLIMLIAYSSNVGYMVTIFGFASAGIAISLKDWFLSIFGWMTILTTGQIKVGNRIKVTGRDGEIIGDVLDVSLLKITLYEDVTLLSYVKDQRAGRVVFIPNNYIFTHIIYNYNHSGMQTIWDSVYIMLSFDSDFDKAIAISKEIASKHTKAYTRLAERQMNKMRTHYSVQHYNNEPRVFTFMERGGVNLNVWFLNTYITPMAVKSAVSKELIETLIKTDGVKVIYPIFENVIFNANKNSVANEIF